MEDKFCTSVTINVEPSAVWSALTDPRLMSKWSGEPEMNIEVRTDWQINSPIIIRGFHHVNFENKGKVLQYEEEKLLAYSHLSSVSRLADKEENYTILKFSLTPVESKTQLTLALEGFPTDIIRKHLEFYWRNTIVRIKEIAELIVSIH